MRLPNSAHTSHPWLIHEVAGDFRLEDVWALPTPGGPDDFPALVEAFTAGVNAYVAEMTLATRVRVQPFRRAQFRNLGRLAKSHAEHDRVVVAILRGDKAGASAAMRDHIELVRDEYEIYAVSV